MTRNRILITCAIASLALGLSACSSDDDAPMTMMMEDATPMMEDAAPLTDLGAAQKGAQDAADLAETAATTAYAAATAAKEAAAGRARFQTIDPSSYAHAHYAETHAGLARADADAAKAAAAEAVADGATLIDAITGSGDGRGTHGECRRSPRDGGIQSG